MTAGVVRHLAALSCVFVGYTFVLNHTLLDPLSPPPSSSSSSALAGTSKATTTTTTSSGAEVHNYNGIHHNYNEGDDDIDEASFGACLMIMDDNHFLVEWLAYHYVTLPLRHVTVWIDPKSKTSPLPILQRWKGRIEVQVVDWTYPDEELRRDVPEHFKGTEHDNPAQQKIIATQLKYYAQCLRNYKLNMDWKGYVAIFDTDEFFNINPSDVEKLQLREENEAKRQQKPLQQQKTKEEDRAYAAKPGAVARTLRYRFGERQSDVPGCISARRLQICNNQRKHLLRPKHWGFEKRQFLTLDGALLPKQELMAARPPKDIVNVGAINRTYFEQFEPFRMDSRVHHMLPEVCTKYSESTEPYKDLIRIHHYPGSDAQRAFRDNDPRGELRYVVGTKPVWGDICYNQTAVYDANAHVMPWIRGLLYQVGWDEANRLLEGAGAVDSWPQYVPPAS